MIIRKPVSTFGIMRCPMRDDAVERFASLLSCTMATRM